MKKTKSELSISIPRWIVFQLVENCNLRCKMCYQWGELGSYLNKENLTILDTDIIKQIVDSCSDVTSTFGLFGGEPFLHPDFFEIAKLIKSKGAYLYLATNGTLLEKHADEIIESQIDRIWISLDGPPEINNAQRGNGVFNRVSKGVKRLVQKKEEAGVNKPELGLTYVVTPINYAHIEEFFLHAVDLKNFSGVSVEMQNFATQNDIEAYEKVLHQEFGITGEAEIARGLLQDPHHFESIDVDAVVEQIQVVKEYCAAQGINFNVSPKTAEKENYTRYFKADWGNIDDNRSKCIFPYTQAEISARGDVTGCHTFYDHAFGNVYDTPFLDIWNNEQFKKLRKHLKKDLLPICNSCCRYYYNLNTQY